MCVNCTLFLLGDVRRIHETGGTSAVPEEFCALNNLAVLADHHCDAQ